MRFRFVAHTADVEFIAYGGSPRELFSNALAALFETMADTRALRRSRGKRVTITVRERAKGMEELLWRTLQDALSAAESRGVFAYDVPSIRVGKTESGFSCSARISAKEKRDAYSRLAVKGISRYGLGIKGRRALEARVVVDV